MNKFRIIAVLSLAGLLMAAPGCSSDGDSNDDNDNTDAGAADMGGGTSDMGGGDDVTEDAGPTCNDSAADKKACDLLACATGDDCSEEDTKCLAPPPCGGPCADDKNCKPETNECVDQTCTLPTEVSETTVQKVSLLQVLGTDAGCDLDGDGQPNNVLGGLLQIYQAANTQIQELVDDGGLVLAIEPKGFAADGTEFALDLYLGEPTDADAAPEDQCNYTDDAANCSYVIDPVSYNLTTDGTGMCTPLIQFAKATVTDGKLSAGPGKFTLALDIQGIQLALSISDAQLTGDGNIVDGAWTKTTEGQLCGVITRRDLDNTVDNLPDELLAEIGFDKATVKSLIGNILKADIDTDGKGTCSATGEMCSTDADCSGTCCDDTVCSADGDCGEGDTCEKKQTCVMEDAISVALSLETVGGTITGLKSE